MRRVLGCRVTTARAHVSATCANVTGARWHSLHATTALRQAWARNVLRPWMCTKPECRAVNRAKLTECEQCKTEKPSLRGWKCVKCQTCNYSGVKHCKSCHVSASESKDYWMCAVCKENNRVDELDDNSRCGFCGYDMAPLRVSEEEIMRRAHEQSQKMRERQETYDELTPQAASEQWGNPLADVRDLPAAVRHPLSTLSLSSFEVRPLADDAHEQHRNATLRDKMANTLTAEQGEAAAATTEAAAATTTQPLGATANANAEAAPPGYDWVCRERTCGHLNAGDEATCTQCGKPFRSAQWVCEECGAINHQTRSRCFSCQVDIPAWYTCQQCSTRTSIYEAHCRSCQAARPQPAPRTPSEVRRSRDAGSRRASAAPWRSADWVCDKCAAVNFARRSECYQCSAPRASGAATADGADGSRYASSSNDDDAEQRGVSARPERVGRDNWLCAQCSARNFRTRNTCWQCGKPSDFATAPASSAPRFAREGFQDTADRATWPAAGQTSSWRRSEDWVCAKCFARNFRSRLECFKCGARKVVTSAHPRAFARKPAKL